VKKKCYVMSDHQEMMKKKFHSDNFQLNKIAARWPAKAVAQLSFSQ